MGLSTLVVSLTFTYVVTISIHDSYQLRISLPHYHMGDLLSLAYHMDIWNPHQMDLPKRVCLGPTSCE